MPGNQTKWCSEKQLLQIALLWLGTGLYHSMSDMHDVSKANVCRAVHEVMLGVNRMLLPQWIHWPRNMTEWRASFMIWGECLWYVDV